VHYNELLDKIINLSKKIYHDQFVEPKDFYIIIRPEYEPLVYLFGGYINDQLIDGDNDLLEKFLQSLKEDEDSTQQS